MLYHNISPKTGVGTKKPTPGENERASRGCRDALRCFVGIAYLIFKGIHYGQPYLIIVVASSWQVFCNYISEYGKWLTFDSKNIHYQTTEGAKNIQQKLYE